MERLRAEGVDPYPPVTLWATRTRDRGRARARTTRRRWSSRRASRAALPRRRPADLAARARQDGVPRPARPVGLDPGRRARGRARAGDATTASSNLDIGDIVGVDGCVYVTQRGQLALAVSECTLLTKTLRPPPDKHHGLGDTGTRYRYRELDLIANEETRELFVTRAQDRRSRSANGWTNATSSRSKRRRCSRSPAAPARGRSRPTTTRSTATCTCASRSSCSSTAASSAAWRTSTTWARCSATRASRRSTARSSRSSSSCAPTRTTTTWRR